MHRWHTQTHWGQHSTLRVRSRVHTVAGAAGAAGRGRAEVAWPLAFRVVLVVVVLVRAEQVVRAAQRALTLALSRALARAPGARGYRGTTSVRRWLWWAGHV